MKAIQITSDNQHALADRYGKEDLEEFPIGYIMITYWGDNGDWRYNGVLTQTNFDEMFVKGKNLQNGFFEVGYK